MVHSVCPLTPPPVDYHTRAGTPNLDTAFPRSRNLGRRARSGRMSWRTRPSRRGRATERRPRPGLAPHGPCHPKQSLRRRHGHGNCRRALHCRRPLNRRRIFRNENKHPNRVPAGVGGCTRALLVKETDLTQLARDGWPPRRRRMPWLGRGQGDTSSKGPRARRVCSTSRRSPQLIVYRAFLEATKKRRVPCWPELPCPGCSLVADQVPGRPLNAVTPRWCFRSRGSAAVHRAGQGADGWENALVQPYRHL